MWEWSKTLFKSRKGYRSLRDSYTDLLPAPDSDSKTPAPVSDIPAPEQMQNILQEKIRSCGLRGIELRECAYHPQTWAEMAKNFAEYQRVRKTFLKLTAYSHADECRRLGFDDEDMELLKNKHSPENYNVHIKIPFDFGGTLDFNNLCLIKSHPVHDNLHRLIELQIGNGFLQKHKITYIPWFEGSIYHD